MSKKPISLESVLQLWHAAKLEKSRAEGECEKYRRLVASYMANKKTDRIKSDGFEVAKRTTTKETLSRANCPAEIWRDFCTRSTYDTFTLKKL